MSATRARGPCNVSDQRVRVSEIKNLNIQAPATGKTKIQQLLLGRVCLKPAAGDIHFIFVGNFFIGG